MTNNNHLIDFQNIKPLWKEIFLRSIQLSWSEAWTGILGQKKTNSEKCQLFLKSIFDNLAFDKETKQKLEKELLLDLFQLTKFNNPPYFLIELFFKYLANLERINCERSKITDLGVLRYCPKLKTVFLGDTLITTLEGVELLENLEEIRFSYTKIQDLTPLASLKNLRIIYAIHSKINDIATLENLPHLEELYIGLTKVSNLSPLHSLKKLRVLNCIGSKVSKIERVKLKIQKNSPPAKRKD